MSTDLPFTTSILSRRDLIASAAASCSLVGLGSLPALAQTRRGHDLPPVAITRDNPAIAYSRRRCEECGDCRAACRDTMTVSEYATPVTPYPCIHCGQCIQICPEDALREVDHTTRVQQFLADKSKVVVAATAPAVRVAIREMFGGKAGDDATGILVAALKSLGFSYVLDTTFAADVTVMEEAAELLEHIKRPCDQRTPLWTSCCPAWVRFAELYFPQVVPQLATTKSPLLIQGALIKTYFAQKHFIDPKNIVVVAIAPCTAKKAEIVRPGASAASRYYSDASLRDVDAVLTTREFGSLLKSRSVPLSSLEPSEFDTPMGTGSGGGTIFGATGGVTEAVLRTAHWQATGNDAPETFLRLTSVRGMDAVRDATVTLGSDEVRVAVVHGTGNARKLLERGDASRYDLIEVMACRGGCSGGGGQPRSKWSEVATSARLAGLYAADTASGVRVSSANPQIKTLYDDFLDGKPLSETSRKLLHTRTE
ncbi:MAG: [FeFe] hydrogenase, group A [Thermoguttaceae bacterium]